MYALDIISGEMQFFRRRAEAVAAFEKQALECVLYHNDIALMEKYHVDTEDGIVLESELIEDDEHVEYVAL